MEGSCSCKDSYNSDDSNNGADDKDNISDNDNKINMKGTRIISNIYNSDNNNDKRINNNDNVNNNITSLIFVNNVFLYHSRTYLN